MDATVAIFRDEHGENSELRVLNIGFVGPTITFRLLYKMLT